jgi:hypothetical protein
MSINHTAIVTRIKNVRAFGLDEKGKLKADKLKLGTCYGSQVVVSLDTTEGQWGLYFNSDLQLGDEFAKANDLIRRKDENGNAAGGMFDDKKRVRSQKFRGEISDGFFIPIQSLSYIGDVDVDTDHVHVKSHVLKEGDQIESLDGHILCNKYVTQQTLNYGKSQSSGLKKDGSVDKKFFPEHFDTAQFGRNLNTINENDLIYILPKKHGTSVRAGITLVNRKLNFIEKFLKKLGIKIQDQEYKFVVGSRRVIKGLDLKKDEKSFHRKDLWKDAVKSLEPNLHKGEIIYGEICGYEGVDKPIMGFYNNKSLGKEFLKKYGNTTVFSYGCNNGEYKFFIYRIAHINQDGIMIDLSYDQVLKRCEQLNVECSKPIWSGYIKDLPMVKETLHENLEFFVESLQEKSSVIDGTHIEEGFIIQCENYPSPKCLKAKSFSFKVLEGIIKDSGVIDMEEAS